MFRALLALLRGSAGHLANPAGLQTPYPAAILAQAREFAGEHGSQVPVDGCHRPAEGGRIRFALALTLGQVNRQELPALLPLPVAFAQAQQLSGPDVQAGDRGQCPGTAGDWIEGLQAVFGRSGRCVWSAALL